jgi:hypothetical protein
MQKDLVMPASKNLHNTEVTKPQSGRTLDNVSGRRQTKRHERHRLNRNTPLIQYRHLFLNLLHGPDWFLGMSAG